jgi:hypothetical protein
VRRSSGITGSGRQRVGGHGDPEGNEFCVERSDAERAT